MRIFIQAFARRMQNLTSEKKTETGFRNLKVFCGCIFRLSFGRNLKTSFHLPEFCYLQTYSFVISSFSKYFQIVFSNFSFLFSYSLFFFLSFLLFFFFLSFSFFFFSFFLLDFFWNKRQRLRLKKNYDEKI